MTKTGSNGVNIDCRSKQKKENDIEINRTVTVF